MSELIVNLSGYGNYSIHLDLHDPAQDDSDADVWVATFCDVTTEDCEMVYFEMAGDYEAWDIIDEAIQTYRMELGDL